MGGQDSQIPQWKNLHQLEPSLSSNKLMCNLANEITPIDPTVSNEIIESLLSQQIVLQNDSLYGACLLARATNFMALNSSVLAEKNLKDALRIFETMQDTLNQITALSKLGQLNINQLEYQKAMLYLETAEKLAQIKKDHLLRANILLDMAGYLFEMEDTTRIHIHLDTAQKIAVITENPDILEKIYLNRARLSGLAQNHDKRHEFLLKALETTGLHSNAIQKATILFALSNSMLYLGDTTQSLQYLEEANELEKIIAQQKFASVESSYNLLLVNTPDDQTNVSSAYLYISIFTALFVLMIIYLIRKNRNTKNSNLQDISKLKDTLDLLQSELIDFKTAVDQRIEASIEMGNKELELKRESMVKLESAIEYAKQSEYLKDMFLSKLSHEVRSPLTTILGFTSLLETELAVMENQELYEYASTITQSGQSLIDLLNNLFELSLINSDRFKLTISELDLNQVIQEIVAKFELQTSQKGIRIVVSPGKLKPIESDKMIIGSILSMVLDNSVRFTEKGYIKVGATINELENQVTIQITDTGIGIDKAYIQDVFEPYRKEKLGYSNLYQGAGLSLPLSKKMAEALGGTISLESEKGVGTTFFLTIPVKKSTSPKADNPIMSGANNHNSDPRQILLVDPDPLNQILIEKMIGKLAGMHIVDDVTEAFETLNGLYKNNQNIDLILLAVKLNDMSREIQFIQQIKSEFQGRVSIPVVAITGYSLIDDPRKLIDSGFSDYIAKPIMKTNLLSIVNKMLFHN
jgi:signal transduction histidine kinase/CheY-like chemotaxis protein